MAVDFFYKVQIGSIYVTSDGMTGGTRAIAEVDGLDAFEMAVSGTEVMGQDIKALSGKVYTNLRETVIDAPITITFPLLTTSIKTSIQGVLNSYLATPTPFTLVFTGTPGTFTGTGRPRWEPRPIRYGPTYQNDKLKNVVVSLYMTLN